MDDDVLSGGILPPNAQFPSPQSVALARRIATGAPSAELQALLRGPIGDAVADAAGYADDAIAESTRAAYVKARAILPIGAEERRLIPTLCR